MPGISSHGTGIRFGDTMGNFRQARTKSFRQSVAALGMAACCSMGLVPGAMAGTLQDVLARKDLRCGVFPDDPGRSAIDRSGRWSGFYVDFCRAVAAAVLGNPDFVTYVEVGPETRFTSLAEKKTDVVMYSTTWTLMREARYKVVFPTVYLFDGQGFLVRKQSGIRKFDDFNGKSVCVTENTTTQANLQSLIALRGLKTKVVFANGDSFFRGSCDAYSADAMNLAANRANRADNPAAYDILPERISREPIGPMVRDDDAQWSRIIRSVVHAVILAEELGLTRDNVERLRKLRNAPETENLLGNTPLLGDLVGLDAAWGYRMLKAVGNYGEIFNRNFGPDTPLGMERGVNRPWSQGGLLYAPLFR